MNLPEMEALIVPQIFKIGSYLVFIWVNEGKPLEPVHVHVSKKRPEKDATKIWITRNGGCLVANNNSKIPLSALRGIVRIIETRSFEIISIWKERFGEVSFYC